jgi:large subunit ribosomal protein L20
MVRIKTNVYSHKRKKRVLKEAKGQFGDRSKRYKEAIKSLIGSRQYAYFDRKKKKSEYRSLWIIRLNAACRESGLTYSRLISGLKAAQIVLDRKVLADLAVTEPEIFAQILEQAKAGKPAVEASAKGEKKTVKKTAKKA